ncbi:MAG TPA: peptidoglycan-associated lipoprotein Pal [Longimicrobiales bacterium]|nr:peptidoglycan-associated lipoprotein Pal [Longimicrobiales bacterium]
MKRVMRVAAVGSVLVLVSACGKKQPETQPQPAPPAERTAPPSQPATPPATAPSNGDAEREAERRRMLSVLEQVVHFDYDEATIRSDAQEQLGAKAQILRANPQVRIRIEGHADERGSLEYNLALGMRRANAVRDYLTGFGIDASRFEMVSFGEDRPMAQGSNDSAWAQNRRAEFRASGF